MKYSLAMVKITTCDGERRESWWSQVACSFPNKSRGPEWMTTSAAITEWLWSAAHVVVTLMSIHFHPWGWHRYQADFGEQDRRIPNLPPIQSAPGSCQNTDCFELILAQLLLPSSTSPPVYQPQPVWIWRSETVILLCGHSSTKYDANYTVVAN